MAKPTQEKEVETWTVDGVDAFLKATSWHRWAIAFRLNVLYGLRRSELIAFEVGRRRRRGRHAPDRREPRRRPLRRVVKQREERSRRTIPLDDETLRVLARRRAEHAAERLAAGSEWEDNDLIIATRKGGLALPGSYDRALERFVHEPSFRG